jgi:hypothetical protein
MVGFLDLNGNGVTDPGDMTTGFDVVNSFVTVSGAAASAPTLVIPGTNALVSAQTDYDAGSGGYNLHFNIDPNRKLPVYASICGGPHIATPSDFGLQKLDTGGRWRLDWGIGSVPSAVESYALNVTYSDGTSETLAAPVTRVFTDAPTLVSPSGAGASSAPTLTWTIPLSAPSSYMQEISVSSGSGYVWDYLAPGGITSVVYDVDGSASQPTLTSGQTYNWQVRIGDQFGNTTTSQQGTFQVL